MGGRSYWHLAGTGQDAAKHSTMLHSDCSAQNADNAECEKSCRGGNWGSSGKNITHPSGHMATKAVSCVGEREVKSYGEITVTITLEL